MRHEGTALGAVLDELVRNQIGFERADAVTLNALYPIERLNQVDKLLAGSLTKVADVHTGEHNLLTTLGSGLLGLRYQRGNRWVARKTTGVGNGTVGAEVIATILHLQKIARAVTL